MLEGRKVGFWRFQHLAGLILAIVSSLGLTVSRMQASETRNAAWGWCLLLWFWTSTSHVLASLQDGFVIAGGGPIASLVDRDAGPVKYWIALAAMSLFYFAISAALLVFAIDGWYHAV